jgi:myo-inositol-1(or 4)-monophosphatase
VVYPTFRAEVNMASISPTVISRTRDVERIAHALTTAREHILTFDFGALETQIACNGDPVTALDHDINDVLRDLLPSSDEGWLSEESKDDLRRVNRERVWVVDAIDGTRELVAGLPEWSVSVGLVEHGRPVAGGVLNPSTGELFLGSLETGVELRRLPATAPAFSSNDRSLLLVSRREYNEGRWSDFVPHGWLLRPVGSVAYRLALVASGCAGATCTYQLRHEWDIAAGIALVTASGGTVQTATAKPIVFNQPVPRIDSFVAISKLCSGSPLDLFLAAHRRA